MMRINSKSHFQCKICMHQKAMYFKKPSPNSQTSVNIKCDDCKSSFRVTIKQVTTGQVTYDARVINLGPKGQKIVDEREFEKRALEVVK